MIFIKKYGFYFISLLIFIAMMYFSSIMNEKYVQFILRKYADVVELFFNNSHEYVLGIGYVDYNNTYIIGRNCLGINFISLLFGFNSFAFLKYFKGFKKILWIGICFVSSIIIGFIANCSRLISSIPFARYSKFNLIHASIGIAIYLFIIIFIYGILKIRFERKGYV